MWEWGVSGRLFALGFCSQRNMSGLLTSASTNVAGMVVMGSWHSGIYNAASYRRHFSLEVHALHAVILEASWMASRNILPAQSVISL